MNRLAHRVIVEATIHAMRARLEHDFSLREMADLAAMSTYYFCRTFQSVTGIPPFQYLAALRLSEATRLLLTTRRSVTDVCFSVGYNSFGTFVRRYTSLVGVSPRRLRQLAPKAVSVIARMAQRMHASPPCGHGPSSIDVQVPATFAGPLFVGAFTGPVPQGRPKSCVMLTGPGRVSFAEPPTVDDWIFVAGFPHWEDPVRCLVDGNWIRGSMPYARGAVIRARPAEITDPPLVLAVPVVVVELAGGSSLGDSFHAARTAASSHGMSVLAEAKTLETRHDEHRS